MQQPRDSGVPGLARASRESGGAEAFGQRLIAHHLADRAGDRLRRRLHHEAVHALVHKLRRTAAVATCDHRLAGRERLDRDQSEVLRPWHEAHDTAAGEVIDQRHDRSLGHAGIARRRDRVRWDDAGGRFAKGVGVGHQGRGAPDLVRVGSRLARSRGRSLGRGGSRGHGRGRRVDRGRRNGGGRGGWGGREG